MLVPMTDVAQWPRFFAMEWLALLPFSLSCHYIILNRGEAKESGRAVSQTFFGSLSLLPPRSSTDRAPLVHVNDHKAGGLWFPDIHLETDFTIG
jgi:hypothetical protein